MKDCCCIANQTGQWLWCEQTPDWHAIYNLRMHIHGPCQSCSHVSQEMRVDLGSKSIFKGYAKALLREAINNEYISMK